MHIPNVGKKPQTQPHQKFKHIHMVKFHCYEGLWYVWVTLHSGEHHLNEGGLN